MPSTSRRSRRRRWNPLRPENPWSSDNEYRRLACPWDIADKTVEGFAERLTTLGIDAVNVAAAYHSARVLAPRSRTGTVRLLSRPDLYVDVLVESPWGDLVSDVARSTPGFCSRLRNVLEQRGIRPRAWTVLLHSSELGRRLADVIGRNCFGDRYPWAVCSAQPSARAYATAVVGSPARRQLFDTAQLESVGYLGYRHIHHHVMEGVPSGPVEELLLFLCICLCVARTEAAGIEVDGLQDRLAGELRRRWRADESSIHITEALRTITADEDLRHLFDLGQKGLAKLRAELAEFTRAEGVELEAIAAIFASTLEESTWIEGTNLDRRAESLDRFLVLEYGAAPGIDGDWIGELDAALSRWAPEDISLGVSLMPAHVSSFGHADEGVAAAAERGLRRLSVYT